MVTIQFAKDKCRNLTLFKNQVLNDLEQKEKDNTSPGFIVRGAKFMFMFVLSFYLYSLVVKDGCSLLTKEWKADDNITMYVNYNPF